MMQSTLPSPVELREDINPRIRRSLIRNFHSFREAIFELVDNAFDKFDGRVGGETLTVRIKATSDHVIVQNVGGRGMSVQDLQRWLNWGESDAASVGRGIGEFGQGGKAAIGYIGNAWRVQAKPWDEPWVRKLREDNWDPESEDLKSYPVVPSQAPPDLHGLGFFCLTITKLHQKNRRLENLHHYLGNTYRAPLEEQRAKIFVNDTLVKPLALPLYDKIRPTRFKESTTSRSTITGWIGELKRDARTRSPIPIRGGVRLLRGGRLVRDEEFFGHPTPSYKQSLARLIGEVEIPKQVHVLPNKTDFDRDSITWAEVQDIMHRVLEPHIRRLLSQPDEIKATKEEKARVRDARQLMIKALQSLNYALSGGPGESEKQGDAEPQIEKPPPGEPRGKRGPYGPRMRGMPEWDVRALDPSKRTDWELSPNGEEKPKEVLLINKLFPLYQQRKGDTLYIAESAALALATRPGFEDRTARESLSDLDAIITAFCRLLEAS